MEQTDFYKLFAETGEPLYWLLSRAGAETRGKPENAQGTDAASTPPALME